MASKWEKFSIIKGNRNSLPKNKAAIVNSTTLLAHKGRFIVYTADHKRFLKLVWD